MIKHCKVALEVDALKVQAESVAGAREELEEFVKDHHTLHSFGMRGDYSLKGNTDGLYRHVNEGEWILKFINGDLYFADSVGDDEAAEAALDLWSSASREASK